MSVRIGETLVRITASNITPNATLSGLFSNQVSGDGFDKIIETKNIIISPSTKMK